MTALAISFVVIAAMLCAAALLLLCLMVLLGTTVALRALLREGELRRRHERELQALWQTFLGNHMSENVRINQQVEQSLTHLTDRLASVETRVSDCPHRR